MYANLCKVVDITISFQNESGLSCQMTFKKCIITICQNFFQKQFLEDTEPINISVEHEQNQRLKRQTIGCIRYRTNLMCFNKNNANYNLNKSYKL